ncbi:MAG: T9SS type A sorting domain-containing protein [Bacteroidota bacterium]|nr:T9SS type A sorting domain-containing protein [Bacteroidota bacterium]
MKHVYLFILLVAGAFSSYSVTRFVTPAGNGSMNGSSWLNAFPSTSLQIAINLSGSGDEVWVATGIYYTTSSATRSISFSMKNNVSIYGSFVGTETSITQRNLTAGLSSTLSGGIGTVGIGDNSYHVISNSNLNNTAVIDGFIIRDGNDDRSATSNDFGLGGGIYNGGSGTGNVCSPTIRNCVITNNQAVFGAGIFNNGYLSGTSNPIILNCVITTNTATTGGGGIDNFGVAGNASPIITNCVIYNNTAAFRAGAMYCWGGNNGNASPVVLNTCFVNNTAVDGGAIVCDRLNTSAGSSGTATPNFRNCIFWGNTASGTGPQFLILANAAFVATYTDIDMTGQTSPHIMSGPGTATINSNPGFSSIVNGAGPDNKWLTYDDGLQLIFPSPCMNSGDNTSVTSTDILNNPRITFSVVDMGPYENMLIVSLQKNASTNDDIILYPNPTKDHLYFSGIKNNEGKIKLINSLGEVVLETNLSEQIDLKEIPKGVYFIIIENEGKNLTKKLVLAD